MTEMLDPESPGRGETTSETLLRELGRDPDSSRWEEFARIYKPILERFVRFESGKGMAIQPGDQDDIVQMTLVSLVKTLPGFRYDRGRGHFRGYLRTIVKRMVWKCRRRLLGDPVSEYTPWMEREDSMERWSEDVDRIRKDAAGLICSVATHLALTGGRVRPETQAVFRRHVLEGLPAAEVAAQFGMKPNAVRQIKNRVLKVIRSEILAAGAGASDPEDILARLLEKTARVDPRFRLPDGWRR